MTVNKKILDYHTVKSWYIPGLVCSDLYLSNVAYGLNVMLDFSLNATKNPSNILFQTYYLNLLASLSTP